MKTVTVKDITDRLGPYTRILIHDRFSEQGTVYQGDLINMRTFWDDRPVAWIKVYDMEIVLEVE